ncbi:hypothetical protein Bca101_006782 [Brassica carinata]
MQSLDASDTSMHKLEALSFAAAIKIQKMRAIGSRGDNYITTHRSERWSARKKSSATLANQEASGDAQLKVLGLIRVDLSVNSIVLGSKSKNSKPEGPDVQKRQIPPLLLDSSSRRLWLLTTASLFGCEHDTDGSEHAGVKTGFVVAQAAEMETLKPWSCRPQVIIASFRWSRPCHDEFDQGVLQAMSAGCVSRGGRSTIAGSCRRLEMSDFRVKGSVDLGFLLLGPFEAFCVDDRWVQFFFTGRFTFDEYSNAFPMKRNRDRRQVLCHWGKKQDFEIAREGSPSAAALTLVQKHEESSKEKTKAKIDQANNSVETNPLSLSCRSSSYFACTPNRLMDLIHDHRLFLPLAMLHSLVFAHLSFQDIN